MLYLHETMNVVPGQAENYAASLERLWLPVAKQRDLRLLGYWNTVGTTGRWPESVAVWEMDDWAHYGRLRESQYEEAHKDKGLAEWTAKAWQWRSGGFDRILYPGPGCPALRELVASGVKGKVFLHEIIKCVPGKAPEYVATVIKEYWPIARRRGLEPVGSYRVAFRNAEALNIWAVKDWQTWVKLQQSQPHDAEFQQWMTRRMDLRTDWESKLMTPVSWNPLAG